jgi:hypothetical protein
MEEGAAKELDPVELRQAGKKDIAFALRRPLVVQSLSLALVFFFIFILVESSGAVPFVYDGLPHSGKWPRLYPTSLPLPKVDQTRNGLDL